MKRLSAVMAFLAIGALACGSIVPRVVRGSGQVITQGFDVEGFSKIELDTIGKVELVQGDHESLVVETDDNILPYVQVKVANEELVLSDKGNVRLLPSDTITYRVTAKNLNGLSVNSSGSMFSENVTTDRLKLELDGSGEISLAAAHAAECTITSSGSGRLAVQGLQCGKVGLDSNASGTVELAGETQSLTINSSGSGDVLAGDLKAISAVADLNASGNVTIWATDSLDASIDGSGSLSYYGQPRVTSSLNGSGTLSSLGAH